MIIQSGFPTLDIVSFSSFESAVRSTNIVSGCSMLSISGSGGILQGSAFGLGGPEPDWAEPGFRAAATGLGLKVVTGASSVSDSLDDNIAAGSLICFSRIFFSRSLSSASRFCLFNCWANSLGDFVGFLGFVVPSCTADNLLAA